MDHKKIATNTFYQLLSKLFTTGTGFIITILLARVLGVDNYGDFTKIISFVGLFYLIVDFGFNAIFLQEKEINYASLFYLRLLVSFIIFGVSNIIAFFLPYNNFLSTGFSESVKLGIFIYTFSYFSQSLILSTSAIFQKSLDYKKFMLSQLIGSVFNLLLILVLIFFYKSVSAVIFSFMISSVAGSLIAVFFTRERFPKLESSQFKKLFILSLPIGLMLFFNLVYFRIDIFLLSVMKSSSDVGIYGLSYKFFDTFIAIPLFLSNSLYPLLLEKINSKTEFKKIINTYTPIFIVSSFIIIFVFWFAAPLFSLIRTEYVPSVAPFRILLLSLPFFFLTSFFQWILISKKERKFLMYLYLISAVINIFLNIVFIPSGGYIASAIITDMCEAFVLIFMFVKLVKIKIFFEPKT